MYPMVVFYGRVVFGQKIIGKEKLKKYPKDGYFLYGNHTQPLGDALLQTRLPWPRSTYIIVHPNNLCVPVLGKWTPALGGLPLPDEMGAYKNFLAAIRNRIEEGHPLVIYPEAHIWPYYTKIRPFPDTSFRYPVELGAPSFCFVNTYHKRRFRKRPKMITYIDGPFFPPEEGGLREKKKGLRDQVFDRMTELAKNSDVEVIKYIKKTDAGSVKVEPDMNTVLSKLLPKMAHLMLYTALLDSVASEHAARMVAMQTATDNADELLRQLNLQYNKSRQQAITSELLDIVGGSVNN
jgi:1-acyl-sn-glycerol-3-phosphate acyltransferase